MIESSYPYIIILITKMSSMIPQEKQLFFAVLESIRKVITQKSESQNEEPARDQTIDDEILKIEYQHHLIKAPRNEIVSTFLNLIEFTINSKLELSHHFNNY